MKRFFLYMISLCSMNALLSQPGTLDRSFGEGGKVVYSFDYEVSNTTALQSDGKILSGGRFLPPGGNGGFSITRFLSDGSIDVSFGNNGNVFTNVNNVESETIYGLVVLPDDRIVAAGYGYNGFTDDGEGNKEANYNVVVARYLPDGSPDVSFGDDGNVTYEFGGIEVVYAAAVQADGKIIIGGTSANFFNEPLELIEDFFLLRLLPDGRVDVSFGEGGMVRTNFEAYSNEDFLKTLTIQEDGKIIAAGKTAEIGGGTKYKFALARYNRDGSLDEGFGNKGKVVTDFGASSEEINDIALQEDGRIVVAGSVNRSLSLNTNMGLARYSTDGSLDNEFGTEGKVVVNFDGRSRGHSLLIQQDGKIIISGSAYVIPGNSDFALARCLSNGILDTEFGTEGKTTTDFDLYDNSYSSELQKDGKILLSGNAEDGGFPSFVLARYNSGDVDNNLVSQVKTWIEENGVSWQAQNGDKVAYYAVQASKTGSNFTDVKRVQQEAADDAQANKEKIYSYTISNAQANIYYRIRAALLNGRSAYSPVIYYRGNTSLITVYPNPVQNTFAVNGLNANEKSRLMISNISGNIMLTATSQKSETYNWNVSSLRPGKYVLTVQSGKTVRSVKFVKE